MTPSTVSSVARPRTKRAFASSGVEPVSIVNATSGRDKEPGFRGGRCRGDNDAFAGPGEPDGDHSREAIVSVVGEPGHGTGEQLLGVGVAKLPSQLLRVHHTRSPTRSGPGWIPADTQKRQPVWGTRWVQRPQNIIEAVRNRLLPASAWQI